LQVFVIAIVADRGTLLPVRWWRATPAPSATLFKLRSLIAQEYRRTDGVTQSPEEPPVEAAFDGQ
jgi:hypothetical protein